MTTLMKFQPETRRKNFFFENWVPLTQPAVNIVETPTGFRIDLAAPGMAKEDVTVKVENKRLLITANKTQEANNEGETYRQREFVYTNFERAFRLPETIDAESIAATFNNGILSVTLNKKAEHQPLVKTIDIA